MATRTDLDSKFSLREIRETWQFSDKKMKKDKVAIPYELKLPCKNVRDEMLKIRTFGSYWIPLFITIRI